MAAALMAATAIAITRGQSNTMLPIRFILGFLLVKRRTTAKTVRIQAIFLLDFPPAPDFDLEGEPFWQLPASCNTTVP